MASGNIQAVSLVVVAASVVLKGEFRDALQLSLKEPNFAARLFSVAAAAGAAAAAAADIAATLAVSILESTESF